MRSSIAAERDDQPILLVNLSGRGDKDMAQAQTLLGSAFDGGLPLSGEGQ